MSYPKIDTLFTRDPVTHKMTRELRRPEFDAVKTWHVTEKIDGMNVQVVVVPGTVTYFGRTERAQLPLPLANYLVRTFTPEKLAACFPPDGDWRATLYGEGYGPKIQKGGGRYRADAAVRLFDVRIGDLWLAQDQVWGIAGKLGVQVVPFLGYLTLDEIIKRFDEITLCSLVDCTPRDIAFEMEGIVARSEPLMLDRFGRRVMFKLKRRDFQC